MAGSTHYHTLKVCRSATMAEIKASYHKIVLANHPDKTQTYRLFARSEADKLIREANAAWEILSDPAEKLKYDATLPPIEFTDDLEQPEHKGPFRGRDSFTPASSGFGFSSNDSGEADNEANDSNEAHGGIEGDYRTRQVSTGTVIDVNLGGWRLNLLISSKFRLQNEAIELSSTDRGSLPGSRQRIHSISLNIGLVRNETSSETRHHTINELTISVQSASNNLRVSKVQTLFRELNTPVTNLTIIVTVASFVRSRISSQKLPWDFGFDIDIYDDPSTWSLSRGTCMIFHDYNPLDDRSFKSHITPEDVLKQDKQLKANAWCSLGSARVQKLTYGNVEMWRETSVGYREGSVFWS